MEMENPGTRGQNSIDTKLQLDPTNSNLVIHFKLSITSVTLNSHFFKLFIFPSEGLK